MDPYCRRHPLPVRAVAHPGSVPQSTIIAGNRFRGGVHTYAFKHEVTAPRMGSNNKPSKSYLTCCDNGCQPLSTDYLVRTANHFAFVNAGTKDMVRLRHDDDTKSFGPIEMLAYIAPLNCGQRRGCRYLSGHTPLYTRSNEYVWWLEGEWARTRVSWPLVRTTVNILGHP
jgi:hypothetical protein